MQSYDFSLIYKQAVSAIEKYGFVVHSRCEIKDSNTGEFDGVNIWVKDEQSDEQALYVLLHLFGHSVQWNVDEELMKIGIDTTLSRTEEELLKVYDYERQASEMTIKLLESIGITYLNQWISNWFHADWMWLKHLYSTGERVGYLTYWIDDAELLTPCDIPEFTPQLFESRNSF